MQSGRGEDEATGMLRVSLPPGKSHFQSVDLFSSYSHSRSRLHVYNAPCLFNVFHIFLIFFPTTTIARPENISRDPTAVWVSVCMNWDFQCHSTISERLNESCFYTFWFPKKKRILKLCAHPKEGQKDSSFRVVRSTCADKESKRRQKLDSWSMTSGNTRRFCSHREKNPKCAIFFFGVKISDVKSRGLHHHESVWREWVLEVS